MTSALTLPASPGGGTAERAYHWPEPPPGADPLPGQLDRWLAARGAELIAIRRHLHAHPELSRQEFQTAALVARELTRAGLRPRFLPQRNGVICDIGEGDRVIALRADLDALPLPDTKDVDYRSTVPGVAHACGHDVHTTILLGTGLALAQLAAKEELPGRVRLLFQPAEEVMPSGAPEVIAAGGLKDVVAIFGLHCAPQLPVGMVGVRSGPFTAAADKVEVTLSGPGGHTARPHLTVDLVYALSKIVTELPAALSRRVDPRSSLSLVWGQVAAGSAFNTIPDEGLAQGTVRSLDEEAWHRAPDLVKALLDSVASAYGVDAELDYRRGTPPTVNEATSVGMMRDAVTQVLGESAAVPTPQSLGGEDFSWYVESVPGALARLGTRSPDMPEELDLHRPEFDVDERAIGVGVQVLAATALNALWADRGKPDQPAV